MDDRRSIQSGLHSLRRTPPPPPRLTNSTEVHKPVLALLRVDQVVSALLGGGPLQHCFKQWVVGTSVNCSIGDPPRESFGCVALSILRTLHVISAPVLTLRHSNSLTLTLKPFSLLTWKGHGILRVTLSLPSKARTLGRHNHQEDCDISSGARPGMQRCRYRFAQSRVTCRGDSMPCCLVPT